MATFVASSVISISQPQDVLTVKLKDGTSHEFMVDEVSEVTFQAIETPHLSCPDDNHPHMIDLGLPSGTKWACCNVGASAPEEYGGYYWSSSLDSYGEYCAYYLIFNLSYWDWGNYYRDYGKSVRAVCP